MYNNIGGKIKFLAKWTFIVEAIASIITGIILMAGGGILFILLCFIGPIVAWVSSWILYALGELVEDTELIRKHFVPDETIVQINNCNNHNETTNFSKKQTCDFCGESHDKLNTYISKGTLGLRKHKLNICEKCAKDYNFI